MSLKIDRVQLDIVINNDQARQQLRKLEGDYKSLATEQKKFATGTADWERLKQEMIQVKLKMDKVYESIGIANLSLKELKMRQAELNAVLAHMSPSMKGYADLKKEADAVGVRLKELKGTANQTGSAFSKSFGEMGMAYAKILGWAAAITGVFYAFKKLYDAADEQRVADRRLLFALRGNIDAFQQLNEQSSKLQMATGIEDSVISQIQMLGVTSGKSTEEVKKITEASIQLSSITGKELQQSYLALNKTLVGQMDKTLPRLDSDFKNLSSTQLKNGAAIDLVLTKYKGTAEESATAVSKMTQAWGEFKESLGFGTNGPLDWVIKKLTSILTILKDVTDVFFSFGGSRDAWNAQKDGIQSTAVSVSNFRSEMEKAQKDETRWNLIKKNGIDDLNKKMMQQQALVDATKKKIENNTTGMRNDGNGVITSKEMNDLKVKQQLEQAIVNTTKSKIAILNELIDPTKKETSETDKQKTAYEKLSSQIDSYVEKIKSGGALSAAETAVYNALVAKKKTIDEAVKSLGQLDMAVSVNTEMEWNATQKRLLDNEARKIATKLIEDEEAALLALSDAQAAAGVEKSMGHKIKGALTDIESKDKKESEVKNTVLESAKITNEAIFNIVASRQQAEYDNQNNLLEKQRQKELSNKNLTEAEKEAINAKYDAKAKKLKQDAFKKQKAADIIQAVINTALSIASANRVMPPANIPAMILAGVAGAAQIAVIASQPVPQFFAGRNVTGALDGRQYTNVPYAGNATTGMYTHPTLIADHGSEIVIDHLRSRNITMNYPEILEAIRAVPQHYSGRVPDRATLDMQHPASDISNPALLALMNENIKLLQQLQQEGVQLNYQKLKDLQKKDKYAEDSTAM